MFRWNMTQTIHWFAGSPADGDGAPRLVRRSMKGFIKLLHQVLPSDPLGCFKWPFQRLNDLHLGDQKVTWKKLAVDFKVDLHSRKTNMTMDKTNHLKMYLTINHHLQILSLHRLIKLGSLCLPQTQWKSGWRFFSTQQLIFKYLGMGSFKLYTSCFSTGTLRWFWSNFWDLTRVFTPNGGDLVRGMGPLISREI